MLKSQGSSIRSLVLVLVLGFGALSGCEGRGTSESLTYVASPPQVPTPIARTANFETVFSTILSARCTRCHKSMTTEEALISKQWIVPGDPNQSEMYIQVDSGQMPPKGGRLGESDVDLIRRYIESLKNRSL